MNRRMIPWVGGLVLTCAIVGCDRRAGVSQPVTPPAPATKPENARPTTQELLTGPMRKVILPGMPLSVMVPASWKFENAGPLTLLTGPTPSDHAMIQLAQRRPIPQDRIATFVDVLRKDHDKLDGMIRPADMRDQGRMRVLERLTAAKPASMQQVNAMNEPIVDAAGNPVMITTTPLSWTLSVFVPEGDVVAHYELNLIGFAREQYETDRPLLEKILYSLNFESTVPVAPPPQPPGERPPGEKPPEKKPL